jgi:2,4-dichlorophenol 6-monooxygenase
MQIIDTPVLIVGAGPAGLTLSLALSRYGVRHLLIDKHRATANTPRAHIVNQRTMEIFRDLGIEDRVRDVATPSHLMTNNVWSTSLAGLELARLEAWGTGADRAADYQKASPSRMCNCPQHILEPVIAAAIGEAEVAGVRFGHELLSFVQQNDAVIATVLDRAGETELQVRCRFLIGADGGRSRVAEQSKIPLEGPGALASAANVWFSADLAKYCEHRPGTLYWNASPGKDYFIGAGTLICVKPWTEWVMLFMYDPETEAVDVANHEAVKHRIRKVVGDASIDVDVHSVSLWQINDLVATRYREGNVLIMGDAAHRHPPSNGLGLNTCVADAFNLGWKLNLVLNGKAGDSLLDSYDAERRPVGHQVVRRAIQSIADMAPIPEALGFYREQSDEAGWKNIDVLFEASDAGRDRRRGFEAAIALTNYQFNAHGVELGYRYREGAVVHDDDPEPRFDRDAELFYRPTTWPGARVPHAWVEGDRRLLSTLDLVGHGAFTLITGIGGDCWREAARHAASRSGVAITVVSIGTRDGYSDCYGQWKAVREVGESGCVLVRPDVHVAWRTQSASPQALADLSAVFSRILAPRHSKQSGSPQRYTDSGAHHQESTQ